MLSAAAIVSMVACVACANPHRDAPPSPTPTPAPAPQPRPPTSAPTTVFDYTGTDGEFAYSITLASDGSWSQSEHSGTMPPSGVLTAARLAKFLAALDAAPFTVTDTPCTAAAPGQADYTDRRTGRSAHASSREDPGKGWTPCGPTVDAATARLPGCLSMLIDGNDDGC